MLSNLWAKITCPLFGCHQNKSTYLKFRCILHDICELFAFIWATFLLHKCKVSSLCSLCKITSKVTCSFLCCYAIHCVAVSVLFLLHKLAFLRCIVGVGWSFSVNVTARGFYLWHLSCFRSRKCAPMALPKALNYGNPSKIQKAEIFSQPRFRI